MASLCGGNGTHTFDGQACTVDSVQRVCFNGYCGATAGEACEGLLVGDSCKYFSGSTEHASTCTHMGHKGASGVQCGDLHHGHTQLLVVFFPFFTLIVGALAAHFGHSLPIPYTVLLLIIGAIIGETITALHANNEFAVSAQKFASMDPHLMLFVFLPPLLFESAFNIKWHVFKKTSGAAMLLATSGVCIASGFTALCVKGMFYPSWDWNMALLFGCILSATDPVAVVALLKELGAKESLSTMIEGESLLNDGTAVVIFVVLFKSVQEGSFNDSAGEVIQTFCQMALGGPLWGLVVGVASSATLSKITNDAMAETCLTLACSYLTFFMAEYYLRVSGVLALVSFGLFMGNIGRTYISPEVEEFMNEFWEVLAFLSNTLVFMLAGLILPMRAFHDSDVEFKDLVILGGVYIIIHVARAMVIRMHLPLINHLGYVFTGADAVLCMWGGLRGAVGLALALVVALDEEIDGETRVQGHKVLFHVAGIVLLTLLVNATTIKYLLQFFNMDKVPVSKEINFVTVQQQISQSGSDLVAAMQMDNSFSCAMWSEMERYNFDVTPVRVSSDLSNAHHSNLSLWEQAEQGETSTSLQAFEARVARWGTESRLGAGRRAEARFKEARRRFLLICRASYWNQFREGLLGRSAVRYLVAATDNSMDNDYDLHEWAELEQHTRFPSERFMGRLKALERWGLRRPVQRWLFARMQLGCDIAQGFLVARDEALRLMMEILDDSHDDCYAALRSFALKDTALVHNALTEVQGELQYSGAELTAGIHTHHAARSMLNSQRHLVEELRHEGLIDGAEKARLQAALAKQMKALAGKYSEVPKLDKYTALHNVPWLRGLSEVTMNQLLDAAEDCAFEKGQVLMEEGEEDDSVFIVARGSVDVLVGKGSNDGNGSGDSGDSGVVQKKVQIQAPTPTPSTSKACVTLGQGSCIGEMAWITNRPRVATVQARRSGMAYKIPGEQLRMIAGQQHDSPLIANLCQYSGRRLAEQCLLQDAVFATWSRGEVNRYLSKWKALTISSDDYCLTSRLPLMLVHGSVHFLQGEVGEADRLKAEGEEINTLQHGPRMLQTKECSFQSTLNGKAQFTCLVAKGAHLLVPPPQPPLLRRRRRRITVASTAAKGSGSHRGQEQERVADEEKQEEGEGKQEEEVEEDDDEDDEEEEDDEFSDDEEEDGVGALPIGADDANKADEIARAYQNMHIHHEDKTLRSRSRFMAKSKSATKSKASRRNTRFTASAMEFYMSAAQPAHHVPTKKLLEENQLQEKMGASRVNLSTPAVKRSSILPSAPQAPVVAAPAPAPAAALEASA